MEAAGLASRIRAVRSRSDTLPYRHRTCASGLACDLSANVGPTKNRPGIRRLHSEHLHEGSRLAEKSPRGVAPTSCSHLLLREFVNEGSGAREAARRELRAEVWAFIALLVHLRRRRPCLGNEIATS